MKKILHIVSSISGEHSFSLQLSQGVLSELQKSYPGSTVLTKDFTIAAPPRLQAAHLQAFQTPQTALNSQ